jgi:hypothetical protein
MTCSQCGSDVAAGSAACPNCGAQQSGMGAQGAQTPAPPMAGGAPAAGAGQAFTFDAKRWTRNDRIVGGATLVYVIALFLPWFTAPGFTVGGQTFGGGSVDGLWHGYMFIALILAVVALVYLVLCAGFERLPFNLPLNHNQLLLVGTGITFVLTLISFLTKPSGAGWGFGAYIGLIVAIVAVVPLALPFIQARSSR